jgi:hypothetical protein
MKQVLEIDFPIHIGDTVWVDVSRGFGSCNYLSRYSNIEKHTVTNVHVRINVKDPSKSEFTYALDNMEGTTFLFTENTCFTKEQLYELWRKDIEVLIPEELRNYLWPERC